MMAGREPKANRGADSEGGTGIPAGGWDWVW
jgi:hypothetical protein